MTLTFDQVRSAIALPPDFDEADARFDMAPTDRRHMQPDPANPPRHSAVLILIYPRAGAGLHLLLTKRAEHLRGHKGQISFPGGRRDKSDASDIDTALRETCEEVGLCRDHIEIIGRLNELWIPPSNYDVVPIVGLMTDEPQPVPSPAEVAKVIAMPLADLLDHDIKQSTPMTFRGRPYDVPYYAVDGHVVWGATGMMLSELEARLRYILADHRP